MVIIEHDKVYCTCRLKQVIRIDTKLVYVQIICKYEQK